MSRSVDYIFSIHFSQKQVELIIALSCKAAYKSEKHGEGKFFTVRTNPTLGVSSNMGLGVSEQCWMSQIFCWINLNPHGLISKRSISRTNIIEGNLTCINDY